VYSTVRRLEAKGLLETWMSEPEPVPGGRARKRVRITPAGLDAVRRARARLDRMAEGLDAILGS
jgi:DNA-binding PadR family transcriptional regulator